MARILKPPLRSRHHRKTPRWNLGRPPRAWWRRIGSSPILLAVLVFTASFVWLLPALHERGGSLKDLFDDVLDVSVPVPWSSGIQVWTATR